jgi:hypothetical protein
MDEETQKWNNVKTGILYEEYGRLKRFMLIYLDQRFTRI